MIARPHRLAADACFILLVLLTAACNPPASYEQFVRADEAPEGIYEFTLPDFCTAPATASCHSERSEEISFDLSFYTAPLSAPLQLAVSWINSQDEVMQVSQKSGHLQRKPHINAAGPPSKQDTCSTCGSDGPLISETVWFPAGEHMALYRSGISAYSPKYGGSSETPKEAGMILRVKPINPPERFRGLGIICKRHDGTR